MDKEINSLRETISTIKSNEKLLRSNLASVNATMSTEELYASIQTSEHEKTELLTRLGPLRRGDTKPVEAEEKARVDRLWQHWRAKAEGRKRMALELWAMGTQGLPEGKTCREFWASCIFSRHNVQGTIADCTQEELGLEGDDGAEYK